MPNKNQRNVKIALGYGDSHSPPVPARTEQFTSENELLYRMVEEEKSRPVTSRERKRFENFNGVPPHLRPGPRMSSYPWMSVRELIGTRALLVYLLVREYGLSIADAKTVLRAEDNATVERLLVLGNELGPKSPFVAAAKEAVGNAAHIILEAEPLPTAKERIARLLEPKLANSRPPLSAPEAKLVRSFLVYILMRAFEFEKADMRALLWYPSSGQVVTMMFMGERMLNPKWHRKADKQRVLQAARVIMRNEI